MAGTLTLEVHQVSVEPLLATALRTIASAAAHNDVRVMSAPDEGACVLADAGRLVQILERLLLVAVEAGGHGSSIRVDIGRGDVMTEIAIAVDRGGASI